MFLVGEDGRKGGVFRYNIFCFILVVFIVGKKVILE